MFTNIKQTNDDSSGFSNWQLIAIVILRVSIGWHFLYEGIVKITNPNWSSAGYLLDSKGWFAGIFENIAMNSEILKVIDFLNIWGLTAIGLGLILGMLTRIAMICGMILLLFYYISHPALIGVEYAVPSEGNYFLINKTLIELFALWVLYLFEDKERIGIDRFLFRKQS